MSIKSASFPGVNGKTRFPTFGLRQQTSAVDQTRVVRDEDTPSSTHEAVIVDARGSLMPSQMVQSKLERLLDR